jgi:hypothetical protein
MMVDPANKDGEKAHEVGHAGSHVAEQVFAEGHTGGDLLRRGYDVDDQQCQRDGENTDRE